MEAQLPGVVVVTGASGRLASVVINGLLADGHPVVAVTRSQPGSPPEGVAATYEGDLLHEQTVNDCFESIARDHGQIRALIHCVGTWAKTPLDSTSLSAWELVLRTNLTSTYLCFSAAARHMVNGGTMIAFASEQGADAGVAGQSAYGAAKAGVVRLVESASKEFADRGIAVHSIAPTTILFGDENTQGVTAEDLTSLCRYLLTPAGKALSGKTIRAYGVRAHRP